MRSRVSKLCYETHQFRERLDFHFFHDVRTMDLHRPLAETEFPGYDLIGVARDDQIQHLALPGRQLLAAPFDLTPLVKLAPALDVELQGLLDSIQKILITKRLLDEADRALLNGTYSHRDVAMTRDENDR